MYVRMCLHDIYVGFYFCNICILKGPPDDITNLTISSDTITACSFAVQWSRPSSDPYSYTVRIVTEEEDITDNTTLTNYTVTGLSSNTVYNVGVTANNVCGSSNTANMLVTTTSNSTYVGSRTVCI